MTVDTSVWINTFFAVPSFVENDEYNIVFTTIYQTVSSLS